MSTSKTILFTKMQGLGNDFMVLDGVRQTVHLTTQNIIALANRHTGIGFDQCLLIEASTRPNIDFNYRIFNADGQEVGQCGNGARCLALFAKQQGLTTKDRITVATHSTQMELIIHQDNTVTVDFGMPKLNPKDIPLTAPSQETGYSVVLENEVPVFFHAINVGNPHAVLLVDDVQQALVQKLGSQMSTHPHFKEQINVGFMQILSSDHIALRVYERGCGETQACGSGAVAAAAIARLYYKLADTIKVTLPGGDLTIHWPNPSSPITLTGPAQTVYEGTVWLTS